MVQVPRMPTYSYAPIFYGIILWIMSSASGGRRATDVGNSCKIQDRAIFCDDRLPSSFPRNITRVFISKFTDTHQQSLMSYTRDDLKHIESLYLTCPSEEEAGNTSTLFSLTLYNFTNLKHLKISCYSLTLIKTDAFVNQNKLVELDLSDCVRLHIDDLTNVFNQCKLPTLERLILRRISLFKTTILYFSKEFFHSLKDKPIQHLDFSGTKFGQMHTSSFVQYLPQLREFNASEGGFLTMNLLKWYWDSYDQFQNLNLKVLDISDATITDSIFDPSNKKYWQSQLTPGEYFIQNFTTLFVNGFVSHGASTHFRGNDFGDRLCNVVDILSDNITLNTFCLLKENNVIYLEKLSLANNGLEHVDKSMTSFARYIQFIDISHNRLYRMHTYALEQSLANASELVEFRIANNHLSHLPQRMFAHNMKLKVIDLSNNNFASLTFNIDHLHNLVLLKLDNNKLHTIGASVILAINNLIQYHGADTDGSMFRIQLFSNPLECSCENSEFLKWMFRSSEVQCDFVCGSLCTASATEHRLPARLEYECRKPYIIGTSVAAALVLVLIITAILVLYIRRRRLHKKKQHLLKIIHKYQTKDSTRNYPVFLSYSSADDTFVNDRVFNELNSRLQSLLQTTDQCVATGDTTFRPGFYVLEEMVRLIETCEIIIMCVSKSFCLSPWCKDELLASQYQRKPIILMFLEEIPPADMPKVLSIYFNTISRSKWLKKDDDWKLVPGWEAVCESIVDLMNVERNEHTA